MINKNIMEREELQDQYESTKDILLTSDRNCMCHTKSKSYELNNKKLYKEEKSRPPPQNSYLKHVCRKAM